MYVPACLFISVFVCAWVFSCVCVCVCSLRFLCVFVRLLVCVVACLFVSWCVSAGVHDVGDCLAVHVFVCVGLIVALSACVRLRV